jgi:hypothetical protein
MGIAESAAAVGLNDLAAEARSRWTLYFVMACLGFVFVMVAVGSIRSEGTLGGLGAFFLLFFVFVIVVIVLFLIMLRHAQNQIPAAAGSS